MGQIAVIGLLIDMQGKLLLFNVDLALYGIISKVELNHGQNANPNPQVMLLGHYIK